VKVVRVGMLAPRSWRRVTGLAAIVATGVVVGGCGQAPAPSGVPANPPPRLAVSASAPAACGPGEVASHAAGCVRVAQIAGGAALCALLTSGKVLCWGDNTFGELGDGTGRRSTTPVLVQGLDDAVEIAPPCARRRTGQVVCWGPNDAGQADPEHGRVPVPWDMSHVGGCGVNAPVGDDPRNVRPWPTALSGIDDAVRIAAGMHHACAVRANGVVECWGDNTRGQLGVATPAVAFQRQKIAGLPPAVDVAAGFAHSCARTKDGEVWCWGQNWQGDLGTSDPGPTPRRVPGVVGVVALDLGSRSSCGRMSDGRLTCWGDLCGTWETTSAPTLLDAAGAVSAALPVYSACFAWCALRPTAQVDCIDGRAQGSGVHRVPVGPALGIAMADNQMCVLEEDGRVLCWPWKEDALDRIQPAPLAW
jgi:hypothetical protein